MKKIKYIFLLIMMLCIMPMWVDAATFTPSYNSKGMKKYGSITKINGTHSDVYNEKGEILFHDISNTYTSMQFMIEISSYTGYDIKTLHYTLKAANGEELFTDSISKDSDGNALYKKNNGGIEVTFNITNVSVAEIMVWADMRVELTGADGGKTIVGKFPVQPFNIDYGFCRQKHDEKTDTYSEAVEFSLTHGNTTTLKSPSTEYPYGGILKIGKPNYIPDGATLNVSHSSYSGNKVIAIQYFLYRGKDYCIGTITGSDLRNKNKGSEQLKLTIKDKSITKMAFRFFSGSKKGSYSSTTYVSDTKTVEFDWEGSATAESNENNALGTKVEKGKFEIDGTLTNCAAVTLETSDEKASGNGKVKVETTPEKAKVEVIANSTDKKIKSSVLMEFQDESGEIICKGNITGSNIQKEAVFFDTKIINTNVKKIRVTYGKVDSGWEKIKERDSKGSGIEISVPGFGDDMNLEPDSITSEVCKEGEDSLTDLIYQYWGYVMVAAPCLLMVMVVVDFLKAITGNDADALKKSGNNAIKRVIATVLLLMVPLIIRVVFKLVGIENYLCF